MPSSASNFSYHDHEKANSFGVYIPVLNAANIDDYTDDQTPGTLLSDFITAVNVVAESVLVKYTAQAVSTSFAPVIPVDPEVRNENTLILKYRDTVEPQVTGRVEIRGVDIGLIGIAGTDQVDLGQAEMVTLVNAFEAFAVSKIGNPVVVYDARTIGRKS